jgi:UDP-MurNAc hydroxylase
MEFTIVSHACLDVRAKGKRLVIDPWLNEPTYWSAWWHAPPPVFDDGIFNADYIYITHWHFDHFDPRTLKKFSKHTTVMVPKFPISGLPDQLRNVGRRFARDTPRWTSCCAAIPRHGRIQRAIRLKIRQIVFR